MVAIMSHGPMGNLVRLSNNTVATYVNNEAAVTKMFNEAAKKKVEDQLLQLVDVPS
jgi:hypothetical protein